MLAALLLSLLLVVCLASPGSSLAVHPYIIDGNEVENPGDYPWQCSLQLVPDWHFCGCVIISKDWVLSAAHCFADVEEHFRELHSIAVGLHDLYQSQGDPRTHAVQEIIKHPNASIDINQGMPNDLVLVKVTPEIDLNNTYVDTITMATDDDDDYAGHNCTISGWGLTEWDIPHILQYGRVEVYTNEACNNTWKVIHPGHICAGKTDSSICSGDDGGPLVCRNGSLPVLTGIASWPEFICYPNLPSVFTRISYYREWIRQETGV